GHLRRLVVFRRPAFDDLSTDSGQFFVCCAVAGGTRLSSALVGLTTSRSRMVMHVCHGREVTDLTTAAHPAASQVLRRRFPPRRSSRRCLQAMSAASSSSSADSSKAANLTCSTLVRANDVVACNECLADRHGASAG